MNNYAFIDSQNLNLGILDQGWKLDFARFRIYLKDKYKVGKAFLFIGYVMGNEARYSSLQTAGFHLIFKPTLEYKKNKKVVVKGNVDAELVLHSMIEYSNYDKAIIVSGDGDFHCLIKYLSEEDKLVVHRARRVQRFLSQPFHVAEQFTGLKGVFVSIEDTIKGFNMILDGKVDEYPEAAFNLVGTIEEAIEKGKKIISESK